MRRIIMATIIAVTFIPGIAFAQMPHPNDGQTLLNRYIEDKRRICTLKDDCERLYDDTIGYLRQAVALQRKFASATRIERSKLQGQLAEIGEKGRASNNVLISYLRSRGIVANAK